MIRPCKPPFNTAHASCPRLPLLAVTTLLVLLLTACADPALLRGLEEFAIRQPRAPQTDRAITGDNRLLILGVDGNIYSAAPDGSAPFAYTTDASTQRQYLQPTWSPSATQIAWSMVQQTGEGVVNRLLISTSDGANLSQYEIPFAPFYYSWSPDESKIAYLSNWIAINRPTIALRVLDLAADAETAISTLAQGQPLYFAWEPGGERILTHIGEERITLQAPNGDSEQIATTNAGFPAPQWTPNGEQILFALPTEQRRQLVIETLASAEMQRVTLYDDRIAFDLSPTGDRLAYVLTPAAAASAAFGPLYVYDVNTRSTRELTTAPVLAFFWSPDGEKLAYLATEAVEAASGAESVQLRLRWYVWNGTRSTGYDIILPSRIFLQRYLAFFDQYARSMTIWSPDSQAFAYAGIDRNNRSGIWVQNLADEAPRRVAPGVFVAWSPR